VVPLALDLEARLMATLSAEERKNLDAIMQKLTRQIEALGR